MPSVAVCARPGGLRVLECEKMRAVADAVETTHGYDAACDPKLARTTPGSSSPEPSWSFRRRRLTHRHRYHTLSRAVPVSDVAPNQRLSHCPVAAEPQKAGVVERNENAECDSCTLSWLLASIRCNPHNCGECRNPQTLIIRRWTRVVVQTYV